MKLAPLKLLGRLRWLIALLLLALLVWVVRAGPGDLPSLRELDYRLLLAVVVLHVAGNLLGGEVLTTTLTTCGQPLSRAEAAALVWVRGLTGIALPRSGIVYVGLHLRSRHRLPWSTIAPVVVAPVLVQIGVVGAVGTLLQLASPLTHGRPTSAAWLLVWVCCLALTVASTQLPRLVSPERRSLVDSLASSVSLLRSPRCVARLSCLYLAILAVRALALWVTFLALSPARVEFLGVLEASILGDLATLLSLTPQGLGLREAALVVAHDLIGSPPSQVLAVGLAHRLVGILVVAVGAPLAIWFLHLRRSAEPTSQCPRSGADA